MKIWNAWLARLKLHAKENRIKEREKKNTERAMRRRQLESKYWGLLLIIDIMALSCIIMNMGAVLLTNWMVADAKEDITIIEANPVVAKIEGLETTKAANRAFMQAVRILIGWGALIWAYLNLRLRFYTKNHIITLATIAVFCFYVIGLDFFNNLGYFLGIIT